MIPKKKTNWRYTKEKEKGIKAYHYRKLSANKGKEEERNKELQKSQKTMIKMVIISS